MDRRWGVVDAFCVPAVVALVVAFREIRAWTTVCYSLTCCDGVWIGAVNLTGMWRCAVVVTHPTTMRFALVLHADSCHWVCLSFDLRILWGRVGYC